MIHSATPTAERDPVDIHTALDLPEVPAADVIPVKPTPFKRPDTPKMPAAASPSAPASDLPDDVRDWI